ncbi:MAG: hypothetical protein ACXACY_26520, partial [Candidatus Hodarchaeales archaeon]
MKYTDKNKLISKLFGLILVTSLFASLVSFFPVAFADDSNYAPLEDWNVPTPPQWSYHAYDTTTTFNGTTTIRGEGEYDEGDYLTREVNSEWKSISIGDEIVVVGQLQTDPSTEGWWEYPHGGARMGVDFYNATGNIGGISWEHNGTQADPSYTPALIRDNYVLWNETGWNWRRIWFEVPSTFNGETPIGLIVWFQAYSGRYSGNSSIVEEMADCWLSDFWLLRNPTDIPNATEGGGDVNIYVSSNPEVNSDYTLNGTEYQTPNVPSVTPNTIAQFYTDNLTSFEGNGYLFDYWLVNGTTEYSSQTVNLNITYTTTLVIYYNSSS